MDKQQALEALLENCRIQDLRAPDRNEALHEELADILEEATTSTNSDSETQIALVQLGGRILWLLTHQHTEAQIPTKPIDLNDLFPTLPRRPRLEEFLPAKDDGPSAEECEHAPPQPSGADVGSAGFTAPPIPQPRRGILGKLKKKEEGK